MSIDEKSIKAVFASISVKKEKMFVHFSVEFIDFYVDFYANCIYNVNKTSKEVWVMDRKIMGFLREWKQSSHRKPLILQGARQVGKTYSILEFGRMYYENVAYFNFETNPKLNETFEENISPEYLIPILSHIAGQTIVKEKTLIVFDEIQLCERALTSLKYFCEDAPECYRCRQFAWRGCKPGEIFFSGRESGYENAISNGYGRIFACTR